MKSRRSDRSWHGAVVCALAWLTICALVSPAARLTGVQYADFGVTTVVYIVGTILSSLFGLFRGGRVDRVTGLAIDRLRGGVTDLGRELVNVAARLGGAIVAGLQVVKRVIMRALGPIIQAVGKIWQRLIRMLDRIFGPIINFLIKVREHIWRFYNRWLRPIVDAIEIVRRLLGLLSLFGLDWAKRLDQVLYRLEQYILAPFEFLVEKINLALSWINRIVTLDGLLQRVMLINSTWRDFKYLSGQWWRGHHKPTTPEALANYREKPIHPNMENDGRAWRAWIVNHDGPLAPKIREFQANVKLNTRIVRGL